MSAERRTVVVTGANRGIGYELARQLAARGELVVLTARTVAKARRAARSLAVDSLVLPVALDVTSERNAAALGELLREHTDRVDVLINNAAIHYDTGQLAVALTRTLAADLRGDAVLVNAVCPGWVQTDMGGAGRAAGRRRRGLRTVGR